MSAPYGSSGPATTGRAREQPSASSYGAVGAPAVLPPFDRRHEALLSPGGVRIVDLFPLRLRGKSMQILVTGSTSQPGEPSMPMVQRIDRVAVDPSA